MNKTLPEDKMLVYRLDVSGPLPKPPENTQPPVFISRPGRVLKYMADWGRSFGWPDALKTALKVWSGKRLFFGMVVDRRVVQTGWANKGFCRHYPVERDAVVLGPVWTAPEFRGRGFGSHAMRQMISWLSHHHVRRFYVDTTVGNKASQRMIQKAGFAEPLQ